jgi:hypothetical protein
MIPELTQAVLPSLPVYRATQRARAFAFPSNATRSLMQLTTRALPLVGAMLVCTAPAVRAQSAEPGMERFFVNVNFGYQLADRSINATAQKEIYEETATLNSSQAVNRGPVIDFGVGYRVWGDVFVAVGISRFSDTESATTQTSVPDPLFFNRPKLVTGQTDDLKRSELAVNPHVLWVTALADKLDLSAGAGVSIIRLSQDIVGDFTVATGTQNVTTIATKENVTGVGLFAQLDFIYNINPRYGVGGFARYAGAKVDLPSSPDQNVGGMMVGGGIRLRF